MEKYEFCKIFVRGADVETVMTVLSSLLGREFERRSMALHEAIVDVLRNPDYVEGEEDFVQWPVMVEIEAVRAADPTKIVALVSRVLVAFVEGAGWSSVAACDFEDELPWNGGLDLVAGS